MVPGVAHVRGKRGLLKITDAASCWKGGCVSRVGLQVRATSKRCADSPGCVRSKTHTPAKGGKLPAIFCGIPNLGTRRQGSVFELSRVIKFPHRAEHRPAAGIRWSPDERHPKVPLVWNVAPGKKRGGRRRHVDVGHG